MKKLLALALAILMIFAVCACADTGDGTDTTAGTPTGTTPTDTDPINPPDTEKGGDDEPVEPWKPVIPPEDDTTPKDGMPQALPNGKTYEVISVTDGTWKKPFDEEASCWATATTDKTVTVFDNDATVDLNEYAGFLVKVAPTEENNGIYLRFFFKMADGTEIEILAKNRNLNWHDGTSWTTITGAASNWKLPVGETGYVYIEFPLEEIASLSSAAIKDIAIGSYATSRSAIFSEWSLVKSEKELTAPTKLNNGSSIELVSVTDGTYTKPADQKFGMWATGLTDKTTCIFDNDKTVELSQYAGFLVKKTPNTEGGGIYIRFKFMLADGTEVEVKSANRPLYWYDVEGWSEIGGATSNWKLPIEKEGYVFLPFAALTELGTNPVIKDIYIYNSEVDRSAVFTEWSLVKVVEGSTVITPTKPTVPALEAPKALADGSAINTTLVTDGILSATGTANASGYASQFLHATNTLFKDGAKVDLNNYDGLLVKVATSADKGYAGLYLRYFFKLADGTEVEIKALGRSLGYYNGTEWSEIPAANETASNWTTSTGEVGYVYLDFSLFTEISGLANKEITDIRIYSAKSANRIGTFSDMFLVKKGEGTVTPEQPGQGGEQGGTTTPTLTPAADAPTTLKDGTTVTLTAVTDGKLEATGTANASASASAFPNATTSIFADGGKINFNDYKGLLLKITTSAEKDYAGLYIRFFFKMSDGQEVEIKALGRSLGYYNGTAWSEITSGATASNWTTATGAEGYIYLDFSLLNEIKDYSTQEIIDIRIYGSKSANRIGSYSDMILVK